MQREARRPGEPLPLGGREAPGEGETPPRVVMLMRQFHPIRGGYENQALRLAEEMQKAGLAVDVVTLRHPGLAAFEVHRGIPIHRLRVVGKKHVVAVSYLVAAFGWMARRRRRFDLIHANRSTSGLIAGLIGFVLRKPVLYKLTRGDEVDKKGLRGRGLGALKTACLRRTVDRFVAITSGMEDDLRALGVPGAKIVRIPNGIELPPRADRSEARAALGIDRESSVVTFVGRLISEKGVDWLLEAWTDIAATEPGACLLIVGDGPERPRLEAASVRLGVTASVRFLGHRNDVDQILSASNVFVLPSRLEGVSNALLEAMAHELAVIVGDDILGGNREVVRHDVDGLVVPADDRRGLAEAIHRVLRDEALRSRLAAVAREAVCERFSIASVAARYRALYQELLASQPDPDGARALSRAVGDAHPASLGHRWTSPRSRK